MQEMERLDISICSIQDIVYEKHPYGHIFGFPSTSKHSGNAFAVKKNMQVYSHENVNDKISVISFYLNSRSNITVINAYATTHSIIPILSPTKNHNT